MVTKAEKIGRWLALYDGASSRKTIIEEELAELGVLIHDGETRQLDNSDHKVVGEPTVKCVGWSKPKPLLPEQQWGEPLDGHGWKYGTKDFPGMPPAAFKLAQFLFQQMGRGSHENEIVKQLYVGKKPGPNSLRGCQNKFNKFCSQRKIPLGIESDFVPATKQLVAKNRVCHIPATRYWRLKLLN
jgi:hypothetical protein